MYRENEEIIQQLEQTLIDNHSSLVVKIQAKNEIKGYSMMIPACAYPVAVKEGLNRMKD